MKFLLDIEKERNLIEARIGNFLSKLELATVEDYYHKQGREIAFNLGSVRRYLRLLRDEVLEKESFTDDDLDLFNDLQLKSRNLIRQLDFVIDICDRNETNKAIKNLLG